MKVKLSVVIFLLLFVLMGFIIYIKADFSNKTSLDTNSSHQIISPEPSPNQPLEISVTPTVKADLTPIIEIEITPTATSSAEKKSYGDYSYSIQMNNVTILKYTGSASTLNIPSEINGYKVTAIGQGAFANNQKLTKVTLPSGITSIGTSAFHNCIKLNTVNLPNTLTSLGDYAFNACSSLKEINLPKSLKALSVSTFSECTSLTEVTLPPAITSIPDVCFYQTGINSIKLPDSVTTIGSAAFNRCENLTEINTSKNLKFIGDSAFYGCSSLKSFIIPDGITSVEISTFRNCTELKQITIPSSVTKIGQSAFEKCSSMTEVALPENVILIEAYAFSECTSLKKINIPEGVTSIPYNCFNKCSNLENLILPDNITNIESAAFYHCEKLVTNLPSKLIKIGNSAFYNCKSLPDIILPEGMTDVGSLAFYGCINASEINISNSIKSLDLNAFDYCCKIKQVIIPDSIATIPYFIGCSSLSKIQISNRNPNYTVVDEVFYNKDKTTLLRYTPAREGKGYVIPKSVTSIADYAFSGLSTITDLTIPDTIENIGVGLFYGSTSIQDVTFPDHIKELPKYTFRDTKLKAVVIPDGITKIGYQAYAYCSELESITIPSAVTGLGEDLNDEVVAPFAGCISLKEFVVDRKSKYYEAIDGALYQKSENETRKLIYYPPQKKDRSFTISEGTVSMYTFAFYQCEYLRKLYLPKSMYGVYQYFINCKDLNVMVPSSTTHFMSKEHIADWPIFNYCTNCYLYVEPDSAAHIYSAKNNIPYKIWNR